MNKTYSNSFYGYTQGNGGRVAVLFLLFSIAIYQLCTTGITGFAMVCTVPVAALFAILAFRYRMFTFWTLFVVNYMVMFLSRYQYLPLPASLPNEMLEILLLAIAVIEIKDLHYERMANTMLLMLTVWCIFCTLEVLNDTCGLGIDIGAWYAGARLMAFQLMYAFLGCTISIHACSLLGMETTEDRFLRARKVIPAICRTHPHRKRHNAILLCIQ